MSESQTSATDRYVVVARRYRPRGFEQLVGQDHVARALANAIETGRVGHAYLFTGARGVGKTSTARIFAKALNSPGGPTIHPDDSSDICQAIDAGEDIDVLEIDGASNRGIDEIRQLRSGVGVRPSRARYKIYIIDEVHMLTTPAFNALLKTLEEPPEHVKFIFCTTDPEKIPITVLSRCQRFDFAPVRVDAIADRLREIVDSEKVEADDDALRLLARRANGSMRDSQSLLEQVIAFSSGRMTVELVHQMLGTANDARLGAVADALLARDSKSSLQQIDEALLGGVDAGQLAEQLLGYFRDVMLATVGCDAEMLRFSNPANHAQLAAQGQQAGLQTLLGIVGLLDQALVRIRQSVHGQILLEAAMVQICALPDLQGVAELAAAIASVAGDEKKNAKGLTSGGAARIATPAAVSVSTATAVKTGESAPVVARSPSAAAPQRAPSGAEANRVEGAGQRIDAGHTAGAPQSPRSENANLSCQAAGEKSKLERASQGESARQVQRAEVSAVAKAKPNAVGPSNSAESRGPRPSATVQRRQRLREFEQHPTVRQVIDLFEAEIVRIDDPRPST